MVWPVPLVPSPKFQSYFTILPTLAAPEKVTVKGEAPLMGDACAMAISGRESTASKQNAKACGPSGTLEPIIFTVQVPATGFRMKVCSMGSTVLAAVFVAALMGAAAFKEYGKY